jgi:hypothetical protein
MRNLLSPTFLRKQTVLIEGVRSALILFALIGIAIFLKMMIEARVTKIRELHEEASRINLTNIALSDAQRFLREHPNLLSEIRGLIPSFVEGTSLRDELKRAAQGSYGEPPTVTLGSPLSEGGTLGGTASIIEIPFTIKSKASPHDIEMILGRFSRLPFLVTVTSISFPDLSVPETVEIRGTFFMRQ